MTAVLADGPDPSVDPVGYAEAQIGPLRHVKTSDQALETAIRNLDLAYQRLFTSNGAAPASHSVTRDTARLNAICPGAAP